MMFTEGLDESAISWIKQGTDAPPAAAAARSPLAERPPLGQIAAAAAPRSPAATLYGRACGGLFSPKSLPPLPARTTTRHSGLLGRHSVLLAADSEDEEEESVASWGLTEECGYGNFSDHTAEEDGVCSSDSSLLWRAMNLCTSAVPTGVRGDPARPCRLLRAVLPLRSPPSDGLPRRHGHPPLPVRARRHRHPAWPS